MTKKSWFRYFQYDERKENLADARNVSVSCGGADRGRHLSGGNSCHNINGCDLCFFCIRRYPDELVKFRYILLAAAAPFIIRFLLQEQPYEKHIVFPDNRSGENELNRV
ncbi:hypothetical protein CK203_090459 [Vitis vinifera]|uniref:Uncharacterized protein n=1 Tax=Vitis vinifera TaxID=29760 RepID=A0A438BVL5_VITVI|nr:hypothetical protein CK203_090459 [Vitis vinifera]